MQNDDGQDARDDRTDRDQDRDPDFDRDRDRDRAEAGPRDRGEDQADDTAETPSQDGPDDPFADSDDDWDDHEPPEGVCPACYDESGSCRCFIVLSWEGHELQEQWGELNDSSLDRVLRSGHALSVAGAPPSRTCALLASLPESLAADIESYWVDIAAGVPAEELREFNEAFLVESRAALEAQGIDPNAPQFAFDPADARSPWHRPYLDGLLDRFAHHLKFANHIREKRIEVHCSWAGICAEETTSGRHRIDGVGTSSVWSSLNSSDPPDTWRRMEAMLKPVLEKLDVAEKAAAADDGS